MEANYKHALESGCFRPDSQCLKGEFQYGDPNAQYSPILPRAFIPDPNPISHLNGDGHNYFRSQNPYTLNSYAGFGEVYYNLTNDLKLTGGLRWTEDKKHFTDIPSEFLADGYGYFHTGAVDQEWNQAYRPARRQLVAQARFHRSDFALRSFAHGYKAGGANPPGAALHWQCNGKTYLPFIR